jgi:hypothetical protein
MELDRLKTQMGYSHEQEKIKVWTGLQEGYNELNPLETALLTIFSSTYFCEALFSNLNNKSQANVIYFSTN